MLVELYKSSVPFACAFLYGHHDSRQELCIEFSSDETL